MDEQKIGDIGLLPILKVNDKTKLWVQCLFTETTIEPLEELFSEYLTLFNDFFNENKKGISRMLTLIERYWLPFLYPKLYATYKKTIDKSLSFLTFNLDSEKIGYIQYCNPFAHVFCN